MICMPWTNLQDDFSTTDYSVNGPKAFFSNMPLSKTLTMNLDVPEPWLVEPVIAVYVTFSLPLGVAVHYNSKFQRSVYFPMIFLYMFFFFFPALQT